MHATTHLPARFAWSPDQIADAVPRRLSGLDLFDPAVACFAPVRAANDLHRRTRAAAGYLPAPTPQRLFRIGG